MGHVRKPVRRFLKSFAQAYEPACLTVLPACSVPVSMSHSSLHQSVVTSAPCVSPARITLTTFPSHISNICYAIAQLRYFSSKLKATSSLHISLSCHKKCAPTYASRSPYSPYPACVSSPQFTTLSISSQKNTGRAASVPPPFYLPVSWLVLLTLWIHLMQWELRPCLLKQQNLWFRNLSHLLKPQSALTLLLVERFQMMQFLIQKIPLSSFNSGGIYLSRLSRFSSFFTRRCSLTFLYLLISFLALCYSSNLCYSLIFYSVILTFLTRYFLLTQSNCVIFSTYVLPFDMLPYIFLLILFFIRQYGTPVFKSA